jgi:hypothetical protein
MFSVSPGAGPGYLVAYAERVDDPKTRIWYYPTVTGEMPKVLPQESTSVLAVGIRLGLEHEPGRYLIQAWISQRELLRAEIAGGDQALSNHSTSEVEIVR